MDKSYKQDLEWLAIKEKKLEAVFNQNFEEGALWRDKEVAFVLEKYGINIRKGY